MTSTAITDAYDGLVTLVSGALPNHKKIANPYSLTDNMTPILEQGYGIRIGPSKNPRRFVGGYRSTSRTFFVVITRELAANADDTTQCRASELAILEDAQAVMKAAEVNPTLSNKVTLSQWDQDSGIGYVQEEKYKFLTLEIGCTVEYTETN